MTKYEECPYCHKKGLHEPYYKTYLDRIMYSHGVEKKCKYCGYEQRKKVKL